MTLFRLLFLIGFTALLSACASDAGQLRTFKIAGGRAVDLPMMKDGNAKAVENNRVKIEVTGFLLDEQNRELVYTFAFTEKKNAHPRSVLVEDVTGERPEVLVVDSDPQITLEGYWKGNSTPRRKGDLSLGWVTDTGDTYKVFRFSITTADGVPLIIHQASVWSGHSKPLIREVLDGPTRQRVDTGARE